MAIRKPPELKYWLDRLRWSIFGVTIDVGSTVEDAIDWVIDWLNWLDETIDFVWDRMYSLFGHARSLIDDLRRWVTSEIDYLWNEITLWWDDLAEWWSVKRTEISRQIGIATSYLYDWINDLQLDLNRLKTSWDNFWTTIYPQLIDTTKLDLALKDLRKELVPFWEGWQDWKDKIGEFFSDPEEWLYKAVDRIIERFW